MGIEHRGSGEWFLNVRVKIKGRELRKRETFQGTRAAAEERFFNIKSELRDGASQSLQPAQTFGEILSKYKESRGEIPRSQLSIFTALMQDLGGVALSVFPDKIVQYSSILRKLPSKRSGKRLSNGTINRYRAMIFAALNLAVDLGILDKNPITKAHFSKLKEIARDRYLTPLEIRHLLNIIDLEAPHLGPVVRFNLQVPCRKSELVNMRREDLDLFNNAIRVRNGTTKNDDGLWKPIPPDMVAYFRSIPAESPFLFFRRVGGRFLPLGDFKCSWNRCLDLAGISDFRFHDGRHIAATTLIDHGTPEQAVMTVAGWKTNMLRTYYHSAGKKALGLIRFSPGNAQPSGHLVDTQENVPRGNGDSESKAAII